MRIDIITVLPEMLEGFVHESILARAEKKGLAEIRLHNLRDYTRINGAVLTTILLVDKLVWLCRLNLSTVVSLL